MLAVLTKLLQDRLIVFAMGNDGIDLSTSKQYRLFKALNTSDKTSPRVIMATNLMQDGLHLYKTSNTPGDDKNLQNRTLSALGTRVVSSLVQRKDADPRYGKMDGTSMAAPHVTGIAAVILSNFPELTAAELAMCLLDGATPILLDSKGNPYEFKEGMIPKRPAGNGKEFFYRTAKMLEEILGEAKKGEMEDVKPLLNGPTASKLREDWERGRRQYGMGRVNLEGSLYQAVLLLSSKNPEKVSDYKKILADYQSPADLDGQSSEQSSLPLSRKDIKKGLKAKFERYTSKEGGNKELLSEALELPAVPDSLLEEIKKYNDYQEKQKLP
jgi:subtilisin family serine protease